MSFLVPELIRKKRDGGELTPDEIAFLVRGFSDDSIPEYQVSAWLMACYFKGLTKPETFCLTEAVKNSGKHFDWRAHNPEFKNAIFADKHSSGGVGDKVSLVLAPVAARLGLKVPMMSGRGLGHTGGTVDKLESIPGFSMTPSQELMFEALHKTGLCMMSQRKDICPADRKLYHLRDVTGTIENVELITASIVSKKWAEGVDAIVFDVKCGEAAFMTDLARAEELGRSLVEVATRAGMKARACITRMDEPLGAMIGNALEVRESLWMLENKYPSPEHKRLAAPLLDLSLRLACEMALLAGSRKDMSGALLDARRSIDDGSAHKLFIEMTHIQGAHGGWTEKLPQAAFRIPFVSPCSGPLARISSRRLGLLGIRMGAGRESLDSRIDPGVGIEMAAMPGDRIESGQTLLFLHVQKESDALPLKNSLSADFEKVFGFGAATSIDPMHLMLKRIPE